jgi:hypothetical protein
MPTITVSAQDVQLADTFLTTYLTDQITDADFSEGGVVRDFVVKAIAYVFAYLQKEIKSVKDRQSILSLSQLPAGTDVDEAVDAILSNWFLSRLGGAAARMPSVVLYFSRQTDVSLNPRIRFFRTADLVYVPENETVIPSTELRPEVNVDGVITGYTATVSLKAAEPGTTYNVTPGRFVGADSFNPYFLYAENTVVGQDGRSQETTAELLKRAPTAIAVRNLVNERSINTVLRQNFPGVSSVKVAGFGDPEMLRDRVAEGPGHLRMNVGGHTDIYISTPRTEVTETLDLGAYFARPDNVVTILRDDGVDLTLAHPGDVVRVTAGVEGTPRDFMIKSIGDNYVEVQPRYPFPVATDELTPAAYVTYSIGNLGPDFDNIILVRETGETSRKLQSPGTVVLKGQPHYKIKRVEVIDTDGNSVELPERVNTTPSTSQYQVVDLNPGTSQSALAVTQVVVHPSYTGRLRVTYETLVDYSSVHNYAVDRFERVICSNPLVKGKHPLYVEAAFRYRLSANALTDALPADVAQTVATYINSFENTDRLDLSALRSHIREKFPQIGVIYEPFDVRYKLHAPDGQIYYFTTRDLVSVEPNWPNNNVRLLNGLSLRTPILNGDIDAAASSNNVSLATQVHTEIRRQMLLLGVSDRNIRYLADVLDIQVTKEI